MCGLEVGKFNLSATSIETIFSQLHSSINILQTLPLIKHVVYNTLDLN